MMLYKNSMLPLRNLVQIRYISTGQTTYPEESSCKIFNWKNKSISWENVIGSLTTVSHVVYCKSLLSEWGELSSIKKLETYKLAAV